ncbi:hypothetical protein Leryth_019563 [Lithospermum erythrorhizon]|nr:hypothetical protein Leryth_019563 [Lithospermum erythrorhizon]
MELQMMNHSSLPTNLRSCFQKTFFKHHQLLALAQRWKGEMQKTTSNGQDSSKPNLVHVVKDGETLSCISKIYGVPISQIAAVNEDIVDMNLVSSGQHLKIPSSVKGLNHVDLPMDNSQLQSNQRLDSCGKYLSSNISTTLTSHRFPYARTTGYFLVLPLIAFCIRCMMVSLHHKVFGAPKHRTENDLPEKLHPIPNSKRWKSALGDFDPDTRDSASRPDSDDFADGDHQLHDEDSAKAYMELERDYQKFLSQCGMGRQG